MRCWLILYSLLSLHILDTQNLFMHANMDYYLPPSYQKRVLIFTNCMLLTLFNIKCREKTFTFKHERNLEKKFITCCTFFQRRMCTVVKVRPWISKMTVATKSFNRLQTLFSHPARFKNCILCTPRERQVKPAYENGALLLCLVNMDRETNFLFVCGRCEISCSIFH